MSDEQQVDIDTIQSDKWNFNIETFLTNIAKECSILQKKHLQQAKYKSRISNIYSIIVMIITFFSSLSSSIITIYIGIRNNDNNNMIVSIKEGIVTLLLLFATFIAGIHNIYRYGDIADKHKQASSQFSILRHDIQAQLSLSRNDRSNAIIYMNDKWHTFEETKKNAPYIKEKKRWCFCCYKKKKLETNKNIIKETDKWSQYQINRMILDDF